MTKSQIKKSLETQPLSKFDGVIASKDGGNREIFRGANPLAPLFDTKTQAALARIDAAQAKQPNPMG